MGSMCMGMYVFVHLVFVCVHASMCLKCNSYIFVWSWEDEFVCVNVCLCACDVISVCMYG